MGTESYGIKAMEWRTVRRALNALGGVEQRVTSDHNWVRVELPTGQRVSAGKPGMWRYEIGQGLLKRVLEQVGRAGLDPVLFLAAADNEGGVTWYNKPRDVSLLARALRESGIDAMTVEGWRKLMGTLKAKEVEAPEPQQHDESTPEPKAEYTMSQALALTGLKDQLGDRYYRSVGTMLRSELKAYLTQGVHSEVGKQLEGQVFRIKQGKRATYRFTEEGALIVAQHAQARWGQTAQPEPEPTAEPNTQAAEAEQPVDIQQDAADVRVQPLAREATTAITVDARPSALPSRVVALFISKGWPLDELWSEEPPYALDMERVVEVMLDHCC